MHHAFEIDEREVQVALSRTESHYRLHALGQEQLFTLRGLGGDAWSVDMGGKHRRVAVVVDGDDVHIHLDGETYQLRHMHVLDRLAVQQGASADLRIAAPMPGAVIALHVAPGDPFVRGQQLLVMESMKMETSIVAPRDGIVAAVHVQVGQTFERAAVLVTLVAENAQ